MRLDRNTPTQSSARHAEGYDGRDEHDRALLVEWDEECVVPGYADADVGRASHGLGLLFCRLAVEAQGGRIWVEHDSSAGSVFCVRSRAWRPTT